MTPMPFHDSAHNMYEQQSQTRSSGQSSAASHGGSMGNDLNEIPTSASSVKQPPQTAQPMAPPSADANLFKVNVMQTTNRYPNSSVFLENSDILDDKEYAQMYRTAAMGQQQQQPSHYYPMQSSHNNNQHAHQPQHRHHRYSTIAMPTQPVQQQSSATSSSYIADRARRSSDTRLMHTLSERELHHGNGLNLHQPIFNMAGMDAYSRPLTTTNAHHHPLAYTTTNERNADDSYAMPQATEIQFDHVYQPLELNIHEVMDAEAAATALAQTTMRNHKPRLSLHTVNVAADVADEYYGRGHRAGTVSDNRKFFKSLPNLSASSENLLQK